MAGRFRRFVVRPLIWGLAILALLVVGVQFLLKSEWLRERARLLIEARAGEFLGRAVEVGAVRVSWLPLELELWNLRVLEEEADRPPLAEVEHVVLEADWEGLRRPRLTLRRLLLENPVLRVRRGEGGDNMPRLRWRAGGAAAGRFQVRIGSLSVRNGRFEFDEETLPLTLDAENVETDLLGGGVAADAVVHGAVSVGRASIVLPRAQAVDVALAGDIEIARGRLDILSGRLTAPDLEATLGGTVRWGARQEVDLRIDARGSAATLVALGYTKDEVSGPLALAGDFHWTPAAWNYEAALSSPRLVLFERPLESVSGTLRGDRSRVSVEPLHARYRDGDVDGSVEVDLLAAGRPTRIDARFRGVDAATALPDQEVPVDALASRIDGEAEFRFPFLDARHGQGTITARFTPYGEGERPPGDRRLAVSGAVDLSIGDGELTVASIRAVAPGQELEGEGRVHLGEQGGGEFHLRLRSEDVGPLGIFLGDDPGAVPAVWLPTRGRGSLDLGIELATAAGPGETTLSFDLQGAASPGVSAESARGSMRFGERWVEDLRLELRTGEANLTVAGRVPLEDDQGRVAGPIAIVATARGWPLADVRAWLPEELLEWPVDGQVSGELAVGGSLDAPTGRFDGALDPAWWGEPRRAPWSPRPGGAVVLGALEAAIAFDPERVRVESLRLSPASGEVRLAGEFALRDEKLAFEFSANDLAIEQSPIAGFLDLPITGSIGGKGRLAGSLDEPEIDADLRLTSLALPGGAPLGRGSGEITARLRGGRLESVLLVPGLGELRGGGALDWSAGAGGEELALDLLLDVEVVDLGSLLVLAGAPADAATGSFAGNFRLRLEPGSPFSFEARLPRFDLTFEEHRFRPHDPVEIWSDGEIVEVRSFYLVEAGTANELVLAGRIELGDPARLDLRLQAIADASWLRIIAPTLDAQGSVTALLALRGTTREPRLHGQAELVDGRLIVPNFPHAFENLRAVVLADPGQIVLDEAVARLGGGSLRATGALQLARPGEVPPREMEYRFQFLARDVTLRYPRGWLLRGRGDLVLSSLPGGRQVRGVIDLERAFYLDDLDVGLAQLLRGFFARQRLEMADTDELFSTTQLNVVVRAPGAVRVSNNLARLRGSADLTLRGTAASPVVFGTVEAEPGGQLVYNENEYVVSRARLVFANPYRIEPLVDVQARTRVSQYDVLLDLTGPVDRMSATFTSDPPISDLEVLSLLATGDTTAATGSTFGTVVSPGGSRVGGTPAGETASLGAEAFLAGTAASLVGERVNRLFGLDRFRIAPLAASGEGISAVRVTAGKRLSKDLYVTYSVNPSVTQEQVLTAEWRIGPGLSLVFTQNGDGSYAIDARWEKAF